MHKKKKKSQKKISKMHNNKLMKIKMKNKYWNKN